MASAFTLFGELKADTGSFENSLRSSETLLEQTASAMNATETRARSLGQTSAVNSRQFEKMNQTLGQQQSRLVAATAAFTRGDISAKQYGSVINSVDRATAGLNSRLKDHSARLTDLAQKQSLLSRAGNQLNSAAGFLGIGIGAGTAIAIGKQLLDRSIDQARANRLLSSSATEAGLAQGKLFEKNSAFAAITGISTAEAAPTTSMITRLATYAGKPEKLDTLLKNFADLGAARGINGQDLQDLIGTILSGQDEGLNRLGISDPGILQKAYAKEIGKSVDQLTQQEKVQAAVNAVMDKAAMFSGAAEIRMNSLEGQVAKTTAAWENFANAMSTSFTTSGPVADFVNSLSAAVSGLSGSTDDVRKKLAEGKSPAQVAKEMYPGPSAGDYASAFATGGYGIFGLLGKTGLLGDTYKNASDPALIYQRRLQDYEAKIAGTQEGDKNQELAAYQTRVGAQVKWYTDIQNKQREDEKKGIEKGQKDREQLLNTFRQTDLTKLQNTFNVQDALLKRHLTQQESSEIESIKATTALKNTSLRDQININRTRYDQLIANATTPEDKERFAVERDTSISNAQNEITTNTINAQTQLIQKMRELKNTFRDAFIDINTKDNPLAKILADGYVQSEKLKESLKGIDPSLQGGLFRKLSIATAASFYGQGLDNKLTAFNLRDEARQFRKGFTDKDTPENFQRHLNEQFRAINAYGLLNLNVSSSELNRQKLEQSLPDFREKLDKQIIALTQGIDPEKLTRDQRELAASAREREAVRLENQQQDAIDTQKKLVKVLESLDKNGVVDVHIIDDSNGKAKIETKPKKADTKNYYAKQ